MLFEMNFNENRCYFSGIYEKEHEQILEEKVEVF